MPEPHGENLDHTAIEVAVMGDHNILLTGPPCAGDPEYTRRLGWLFRQRPAMPLGIFWRFIGPTY